jgi:osmotically-inducible protein OsmY
MATGLEELVRGALDADGRITSKTIDVAAEGSCITLHGVVDSLEELGLAQEIAEEASGAHVHNHLSIDGEVNTGPCCPQM